MAKKYTIMTYNIQSCKDYIRKNFDALVPSRVIMQYLPDIVSLNEVRNIYDKITDKNWFNQVKEIAEICNYKYYFFGQAITLEHGPYGNALLSRFPIKNIEIIKIPDPLEKNTEEYFETRSIIKAEIENFTVLVTHIGLAKDEQINAIKILKETIEKISTPLILMGDFNMTEDNSLLKEINLKNSSIYFKNPLLSFPSINPRIKIDYIFTSDSIEVMKANIPTITASDHFPYIIKAII